VDEEEFNMKVLHDDRTTSSQVCCPVSTTVRTRIARHAECRYLPDHRYAVLLVPLCAHVLRATQNVDTYLITGMLSKM